MILVFIVVIGVCLGSFVNAFVWRYYETRRLKGIKQEIHNKTQQLEDLSISKGRSMCPHCRHTLSAKDLVPIFSWLYLRGKCRYCKAPIDDTPAPEIIGGIVFGLSFIFWPFALSAYGLALFVVWLISLTIMLILGVYDARWKILPTPIVYTLAVIAAVFAVLRWFELDIAFSVVRDTLLSLIILWGFLRVIYFVSPKMIGFGDVRLAIALGLFAGSPLGAMIVLFMASLAGLLWASPGIIRGRASLKSQLPFGPSLLIGCMVAVLWQESLVEWLDRLLLGM